MSQEFDSLKTQHLFLLVGANPLPNYVAAMLLAREDGTVHLLHSQGKNGVGGTGPFAENLKIAIERDRRVRVVLHETDDSDSAEITKRVEAILENLQGSVGLNYTGGTKPMATHTYRAIARQFPKAIFTYLDPRELRMIVDQRDDVPMQIVPVGNQVSLSLEDLVALHGYQLNDIQRAPRFENLCQAIAQVCSTPDGFKQWKSWSGRQPMNQLPDVKAYPNLRTVLDALKDLCGGPPTPAQVAEKLECTKDPQKGKDLDCCRNFFQGTWLEEYTLGQLTSAANKLGVTSLGKGLKPTHKGHPAFELDIAAMYGYQLFAISCMATEDKKPAKGHLFEVFTRAQQLGGEEARFAVVCCLPNPSNLQSEIEESWYAQGRVRVFGRNELLDLANHLLNWFVTANKG